MEVMEEAVEPLSQSLSTIRLVLRLPGNDSTESQLQVGEGDISAGVTTARRPYAATSEFYSGPH